MIDPATIPEPVAEAAIDLILKPLGTGLRHYMPTPKTEAIKAMQGVLAAERDRAASTAQSVADRLGEPAIGTAISKAIAAGEVR